MPSDRPRKSEFFFVLQIRFYLGKTSTTALRVGGPRSTVSVICSAPRHSTQSGIYDRWGGAACMRRATTRHSFHGSFSAVSTPMFATKYLFCRIFRDLQSYIVEKSLNYLKMHCFYLSLWNLKILQILIFTKIWKVIS